MQVRLTRDNFQSQEGWPGIVVECVKQFPLHVAPNIPRIDKPVCKATRLAPFTHSTAVNRMPEDSSYRILKCLVHKY